MFDLRRDTRYLNEVSPPLLHFQPREKPHVDSEIAAGVEIEYDMRLYGFPVRWRSKIPVFKPLNRFIDERMIDPHVSWSHTHTFESVDDRNTVIGDVVDYTLPGWPTIARIAHLKFEERGLIEVFSHRSSKYRGLLGDPTC